MKARSLPILITGLVVALGQPPTALADVDFDLSGFGTLGYAISDNDETEYTVGQTPNGASASGTFELDSRLGVQLDVNFDDKSSATLQLLSGQGYNGDFDPQIEWAFVKSQLNDTFVLRVGRMGVPFFMISDFKEVGYANTALRPPEDTYIQAPLGSFDGMDLTGYFEWGETEITAQTIFGFRDSDGSDNSKYSLRDGYGGNVSFERGPARLQLSYIQTRLSVNSDELREVYNQINGAVAFAPELAVPAEDFNGELKKSQFYGAGIELDFDPWIFSAEYTQRRLSNTFISSYNAWYVTASYRWRNFTPYATLSQLTQTSKTEVAVSNPALQPLLGPLNDNYAAGDQQSAIVGLRWDFMEGAALKVQAENIAREVQGASFTRGNETALGKGEDVKLFSIAVDFTF